MLKCTKNESVRGSVPALGKGAPAAGFYSYSLQSISNVRKRIYIIIAPNASFFILNAVKLSVYEARSASDPAGKA